MLLWRSPSTQPSTSCEVAMWMVLTVVVVVVWVGGGGWVCVCVCVCVCARAHAAATTIFLLARAHAAMTTIFLTLVLQWGAFAKEKRFASPAGVAVDENNRLWVCQPSEGRVKV